MSALRPWDEAYANGRDNVPCRGCPASGCFTTSGIGGWLALGVLAIGRIARLRRSRDKDVEPRADCRRKEIRRLLMK